MSAVLDAGALGWYYTIKPASNSAETVHCLLKQLFVMIHLVSMVKTKPIDWFFNIKGFFECKRIIST